GRAGVGARGARGGEYGGQGVLGRIQQPVERGQVADGVHPAILLPGPPPGRESGNGHGLARAARGGYDPASFAPGLPVGGRRGYNARRRSAAAMAAQPARPSTPEEFVMKTFIAKNETVQRDWYVVDAEGKTL